MGKCSAIITGSRVADKDNSEAVDTISTWVAGSNACRMAEALKGANRDMAEEGNYFSIKSRLFSVPQLETRETIYIPSGASICMLSVLPFSAKGVLE